MKNIILLSAILMGMLLSSCGGTKNIVEETPPAVEEEMVAQSTKAKKPKKRDRRGPGMDELFAELNMTDEQIAKYKKIDEKYRTKMRATMNGNDRGAMATKIKALQEERTEEVKGILSAEQFQQYLKWKEMSAMSRRASGGK